jgi:tagatose 1,6-diphosphate aldolase
MWPFLSRPRFQFANPAPLVDDELELIAPEQRYLDDVLTACRHPQTLAEAPELSRTTRAALQQFLDLAPMGHHPGDSERENIASYHFWMKLSGPDAPLRIAGGIGLRIGNTVNIRKYIGHVGYNVYPAARGRHLAERATRLLFPLARHHGLKTLWITSNPDNRASCRTCERLGGMLVETVPVPEDHELYSRGDHFKCRYRIDLDRDERAGNDPAPSSQIPITSQ